MAKSLKVKNRKRSFRLWFLTMLFLIFFGLLLSFYYKQYANPTSIIPTSGFSLMVNTENNINPERIYYEVHPGDTISTAVIVNNYYDHPISVQMEASDAITSEQSLDDANYVPATYEDSTDFGKWVSFTPEQEGAPTSYFLKKSIESRARGLVSFEISIPQDMPLGDYFGVISGSHVPNSSAASGNAGVVSVIKNGVRAQIKVTDTPSEDIVYYDLDLSAGIMERSYVLIGLITLFSLSLITFSQTKLFNKLFKS